MAKQKSRTTSKGKAAAKRPALRSAADRQPVVRTKDDVPLAGKLERVKLPARATDAAGRQTDDGAGEGKYVYCIVQSDRPLQFGPLGLGSEPAEVHTVNYRD